MDRVMGVALVAEDVAGQSVARLEGAGRPVAGMPRSARARTLEALTASVAIEVLPQPTWSPDPTVEPSGAAAPSVSPGPSGLGPSSEAAGSSTVDAGDA